jgi:hypothetical protein
MTELAHRLVAYTLLLLAAACGGDGSTTVDSADGELDEPRRKGPEYKAAPVTAVGTISGTVMVAAAPAAAPGTTPANASAPQPQQPPAGGCAAPSSSSVVVFLQDIATGLPIPDDAARRHELAVGDCELTPAISIATATGTLNLSNSLGRVHHVAFTFEDMKTPMLRVPFSDRGQLVPSERVLAVPGVVDVASDQHPLARARIVVLEHPYGVLTTDGAFTLDSVPPGNYSLVALTATGRAGAKVQVQAGATTNVTLTLPPG